MLFHKPWRILIVGTAGALLADLATFAFDLPVHAGIAVVTGPERYLVSTVSGAVCAVVVEYVLRNEWPFGS